MVPLSSFWVGMRIQGWAALQPFAWNFLSPYWQLRRCCLKAVEFQPWEFSLESRHHLQESVMRFLSFPGSSSGPSGRFFRQCLPKHLNIHVPIQSQLLQLENSFDCDQFFSAWMSPQSLLSPVVDFPSQAWALLESSSSSLDLSGSLLWFCLVFSTRRKLVENEKSVILFLVPWVSTTFCFSYSFLVVLIIGSGFTLYFTRIQKDFTWISMRSRPACFYVANSKTVRATQWKFASNFLKKEFIANLHSVYAWWPCYSSLCCFSFNICDVV